MKITITNGKVTAEAETLKEVETLLSMREKPAPVENRKRHYARHCPSCGKTFDTRQGLGLHQRKAHGVLGIIARKAAATSLPVNFSSATYQIPVNTK